MPISSREPVYPIFVSRRSRARRGGYAVVLMVMLVIALALRLI